MEITKSIAKIRKSKGYSQAKIAEILQTTQQQYSKYETGTQEIPVRHIIKLCEIYGVSANELLGIDSFMTEEEAKTNYKLLYEKVEDLIAWAVYQEHITEEASGILYDNLLDIKEEIENAQG